ncbi:MAG: transglutaminase family protein [Rhodospirillaceae bacterium]|jgi:uncharacterized protein (DUF2126 family)|nr:transglutaminase family protein [Rhodospirillaceae bacterium]
MGGEPTFVSLDNREGPEWRTAALGPDKHKLAGQLLRRLADRFAPGALLHYGQGKWYPGEPLPRWALSCLWRADAAPLWSEPDLLASDDTVGDADADRACAFVEALCDALGLDRPSPIPAYEDAWYHFWLQRRTPSDAKLDPAEPTDDMERDRLARLLEAGLDAPVGYVLPLAGVEPKPKPKPKKGAAWRSSLWRFRTDRLFLVAGDSPMGWRLPLGDLPADDPELVRTALCVEPREGRLHVFLPPVDSGAGFARLIAALEKVVRARGEPVFFEGYLPAGDPAYRMFNVTPDPGVIEVNIHPSASWRELAERTEVLAEEAAAVRLGTEKFRFDGRPTSTGGGNHVVFGGATIEDSPFLRRPDLLRSMLAYWNNHPSMSYLFSGLFIGPTSQHPRVDEARTDSVYELEIAFQQVARGDAAAGRHLERVFQNLLVDVAGNTHRAEFCIDKLYPSRQQPERGDLLELRAFETPHARMNLVQLLLIRALAAVFWRAPYEAPLARWGTRLHDRFMLPHFVWRDFEAVIRDLNAQGYGFEMAWLASQFEFRFPFLGSAVYDEMEIELRQALEPWPVLAEEAVTGGTARTVDASLDRVQVMVRGMAEERHMLVCNGRTVPRTETDGQYVAGIRFRAWDNDRGLHPTIPGQAPLVFDLYDRWSGRALGGCTYHAGHPSGVPYDGYPVNAQEAAARRRARFQAIGHTPGAMEVAPAERSTERPLTLDLRWNPPGGAKGGAGGKSR